MDIVIIITAALIGSMLTFFSGFGLGTILLPIFSLFFPIELAVALTGVVHFLNNIFKISLIGKHIDWKVALRFGLPGILAAYIGAVLLISVSKVDPLYTYSISNHICEISGVKIIISILMLFFALLEIIPRLKEIQFEKDKLIFGGIISGFFGGLSGHQGALRSAFLIKCGLSKEAFIATGAAIATLVDMSRISVYFSTISPDQIMDNKWILLSAVLAAFIGAVVGKKMLKKITIDTVQWIVSLLIIALSFLLGFGIL